MIGTLTRNDVTCVKCWALPWESLQYNAPSAHLDFPAAEFFRIPVASTTASRSYAISTWNALNSGIRHGCTEAGMCVANPFVFLLRVLPGLMLADHCNSSTGRPAIIGTLSRNDVTCVKCCALPWESLQYNTPSAHLDFPAAEFFGIPVASRTASRSYAVNAWNALNSGIGHGGTEAGMCVTNPFVFLLQVLPGLVLADHCNSSTGCPAMIGTLTRNDVTCVNCCTLPWDSLQYNAPSAHLDFPGAEVFGIRVASTTASRSCTVNAWNALNSGIGHGGTEAGMCVTNPFVFLLRVLPGLMLADHCNSSTGRPAIIGTLSRNDVTCVKCCALPWKSLQYNAPSALLDFPAAEFFGIPVASTTASRSYAVNAWKALNSGIGPGGTEAGMCITNPFVFLLQVLPGLMLADHCNSSMGRPAMIGTLTRNDVTCVKCCALPLESVQYNAPSAPLDLPAAEVFGMPVAFTTASRSYAINTWNALDFGIGHGGTEAGMCVTNPFVLLLHVLPGLMLADHCNSSTGRLAVIDTLTRNDVTCVNCCALPWDSLQHNVPSAHLDFPAAEFFGIPVASTTASRSYAVNAWNALNSGIGHGGTEAGMCVTNPFVFLLQVLPGLMLADHCNSSTGRPAIIGTLTRNDVTCVKCCALPWESLQYNAPSAHLDFPAAEVFGIPVASTTASRSYAVNAWNALNSGIGH
ncbi:hypothetical protein V5799_006918 [Amblyomma americanum]|uniref:Uncharacterized protein n=1 Tax=Amblyomma americanum TaxID=6943 RepID=A0AAQ4DV08_AMBAM